MDDMTKIVPLMVSIWMDGQTGESIFDGKGNDYPSKFGYARGLLVHGFVIFIILIPLKLTRGMNSGSLIEQCILVLDANNRTLPSLDHSTNSANVYVSALMVVNPSDVNSSSSFEDDSDVCTGYTTISTSINE
jgi:hypothetical protein